MSGNCAQGCSLGPNADHPGYLGYRCQTAAGETIPFPGEAEVCWCGHDCGHPWAHDENQSGGANAE